MERRMQALQNTTIAMQEVIATRVQQRDQPDVAAAARQEAMPHQWWAGRFSY